MAKQQQTLLYALGLAPRKIGGIEKFLYYFTREMEQRGWRTVLCFDGEIAEEFRQLLASPSVVIESLDGQADLGLRCAPQLMRLLRRYRPAAFAYGFHGLMRVFPWLARQAGVRHIVYNDHSSRPAGQPPLRLRGYKHLIARTLALPVSGIISVSHFVERSSIEQSQTSARNHVIWNGVEVGEPDPNRGRLFRQRHGLPADAVVIGCVCWMVPIKGVDTLLRAVSSLHSADARPWLLLVGDGPQRAAFEQLAESLGLADRVRFTGVVSDPVAAGVFDACDIYCQPSVWQEAMGLAVVEAMSMERPVVASDIGGLPEIVHSARGGLLFPPADVASLRDCLTRLLRDAGLRETMGRYNRAWVLDNHDIRRTAARYADCFSERGLFRKAPRRRVRLRLSPPPAQARASAPPAVADARPSQTVPTHRSHP